MRREILRAGMAVALVGSAAACKKETSSTPQNQYSVRPGECEIVVDDNIRVCNKSNQITRQNAGLVTVDRINDSDRASLAVSKLKENVTYIMKGALEGMTILLDPDKTLQITIEEPLLSATPAPTPLPSPTPFRMEPMEDPSTF